MDMNKQDWLQPDWLKLLNYALEEDQWHQDITSRICSDFFHSKDINPRKTYEFTLSNRHPIVFAGHDFLEEVCKELKWDLLSLQDDGARLEEKAIILKARAPAFALLSTERTILNILQHVCGIATEVSAITEVIDEQYAKWTEAEKAKYKKPILLHTRKTLPGLRSYQVFACQVGGAHVHRLELQSRAMFKDNHKDMLTEIGSGFPELKKWARESAEYAPVIDNAIFEADTPEEAIELYHSGARHLLLDNFNPAELREIVPVLKDAVLEASGGLSCLNIAEYVIPGISRLSMGSITHSVVSADIGLDIKR